MALSAGVAKVGHGHLLSALQVVALSYCLSKVSLSGSKLQLETTPLGPGGQQPYNGARLGRRLLAHRCFFKFCFDLSDVLAGDGAFTVRTLLLQRCC